MKTIFELYNDMSQPFTGCCYIVEWNQTRWYEDGKLHYLNGPAVIYHDKNTFYIAGKLFTEQQFLQHPLVVEHKLKAILEST